MKTFEKNTGGGPTPFDDAFKTECIRHPRLLIPVLRELFPGLPKGEIRILPLSGEHPVPEKKPDGREHVSKRYTDFLFAIGKKRYHLEAQSDKDGKTLLRLVEYDMRAAIEHHEYDEKSKTLTVHFPESAILHLREGKPGRKKVGSAKILMKGNGWKQRIKIPVMNVQAYTLEEIEKKELYFLIPFYPLRFESGLTNRENDDEIVAELEKLASGLFQAWDMGKLSEREVFETAAFSKLILQHITRNLDESIQERMVGTMGGRLLELETDKYFDTVDELRSIIKEKEDELTKINNQIAEKDNELAEKDNAIAEKNKEIAEKNNKLAEKDNAIVEKNNELAETYNEITVKNVKIAEKDSEIAVKNIKLAERDDIIAKQVDELEKERQKVIFLEQKLAAAGIVY